MEVKTRRPVNVPFLSKLFPLYLLILVVIGIHLFTNVLKPVEINSIAPRPYAYITPRQGFLVYSSTCEIPDLDPYHPTVFKYIEKFPPLNCSDSYPRGSFTIDDDLIVDFYKISEACNNSKNVKCCYREVSWRKKDKFNLSKKCHEVGGNRTKIDLEYIKIECQNDSKEICYQNFHGFIHKKTEVEKACNEKKSTETVEIQPSILVIGIDAVSRINFHRHFVETLAYLKDVMGIEEMYGYNKVGDNTFPNLIPVLTGFSKDELQQYCYNKGDISNCPLIWKNFSEAGYRTAYGEDVPWISTFNYLADGFKYIPTDYYLRPYIFALEDTLGRLKDLNCIQCVADRTETEVVLDWVSGIVRTFKDSPYFAFTWINSLTHDYANYASKADHYYAEFLRKHHQNGDFENTLVIFLSDHGMRWGAMRETYIGKLEERLPTLLLSFPPKFRKKYKKIMENLHENSHRLTTPYDLHVMLKNLINFDGKVKELSTEGIPKEYHQNFTRALNLLGPIPENRTCEAAGIDEHWCTCHQSKMVDTDSNDVKNVAHFLVDHINEIVKDYDHCAKLELDKIKDARIRLPEKHLESVDTNIIDYTVIIRTKPGEALFEGTLRKSHSENIEPEVVGDVSRLNLYGEQGFCVKSAKLKKFCFCKKG